MARIHKDNAEYFSHDADMRNDVRVRSLRKRFGNLVGYGIYCMMLETLTDRDDFKVGLDDISIELIAEDFGVEEELLRSVMDHCARVGLFQIEDGFLRCAALEKRLSGLLAKRVKMREIRKVAPELCSTVPHSVELCSTVPHSADKVKESRVKERKVEERKAVVARAEATAKAPPLPSSDEGIKILEDLDKSLGIAKKAGDSLEAFLLHEWGPKGKVSHSVMTRMIDLALKYGYDRLFYAIEEGAKHDACNLAYVQAILEPSTKNSIHRNLDKFVQMGETA